MLFDEHVFLYGVKQLVTGSNASAAADGGFLQDFDYTQELLSTAASTFGSTGQFAGNTFKIGRDYDQASDQLQFRLLGSTAFTGTEVIWVWLTNVRTPGASTVSSTTPQSTLQAFSTGIYTAYSVSASGNGLAQDDVITVNFSTSPATGQANPPLIINFGMCATYASCLVAYDMYGVEFVGTSTQEIRG
jgi:hypothetical protein